jgi:hypothetical protein
MVSWNIYQFPMEHKSKLYFINGLLCFLSWFLQQMTEAFTITATTNAKWHPRLEAAVDVDDNKRAPNLQPTLKIQIWLPLLTCWTVSGKSFLPSVFLFYLDSIPGDIFNNQTHACHSDFCYSLSIAVPASGWLFDVNINGIYTVIDCFPYFQSLNIVLVAFLGPPSRFRFPTW